MRDVHIEYSIGWYWLLHMSLDTDEKRKRLMILLHVKKEKKEKKKWIRKIEIS